jgi:hypothetical protein
MGLRFSSKDVLSVTQQKKWVLTVSKARLYFVIVSLEW